MNDPSKSNRSRHLAGNLAGITIAALAGGLQQAATGTDILPGTLITYLKYTDNGTTVGALNNIQGTFSTYLQVGPDVFYTFEVLSGGDLKFTVTPDGSFDPGIGLFLGSTASPDWVATGVPPGQYQGWDNEVAGEAETFTWPVVAGATYNFVVDSHFDASNPNGGGAGTYQLVVETPNSVTLVPEPGPVLLLGLGTTVLGWRRRRRGLA